MWQIELCVQLKTYDLCSLTAKQTLWEMGYKELTEISRSDYYLLTIPSNTQEEAVFLAKEIAQKTPIFVNPNKHTYYIRNPKSTPKDAEGTIQNPKFEEVLVWYKEDVKKKTLLDSLKSFGYNVEDMLCGVLWQITLTCDKEKAFALVQKMTKELLMNPHSQDYKILVTV